ncbi:hypothetical protein TNCV_2162311 [Trichonephila clavipes]|nr:hypothetical protein TNCV_2162311 [Trichonephila clavipes]
MENMWVALGRQVAGRNYPPTNKNTLIRALTEEWDKLPQQLLDNVVQSMEPSGQPHTSTSKSSSVGVLDSFTRSPHKFTLHFARETSVIKASVGRTLQRAKWKVRIQLVTLTKRGRPRLKNSVS